MTDHVRAGELKGFEDKRWNWQIGGMEVELKFDSDSSLKSPFLKGLDEDTIRYIEPACFFSLAKSINLILFLNGSDFKIEEVQEKSYFPRPVPSETQAAWSIHQSPVSSTNPSSGSAHVFLPVPKSKPCWEMAAAVPEPPVKTEPPLLSAPTPVALGLLIKYEGMSWSPTPDPAPVLHEHVPVGGELMGGASDPS
ncbi:hypothetical protein DPX16_5262 [Anabarilius grahami]|uniref:Uncharacterized protein n=1 Tax=Anabarilius grahami TaxID=495550 RepID=A0A3N0Y002_ANAGA|nr:hypothetical protein DPX16_5262 [Anabarilius grahami]